MIESLNKRAAVAVARFVACSITCRCTPPRRSRRSWATCSANGYQQILDDSEDEEDQERLANIEELLTAAREFDERNPSEGPLEEFLEESSWSTTPTPGRPTTTG